MHTATRRRLARCATQQPLKVLHARLSIRSPHPTLGRPPLWVRVRWRLVPRSLTAPVAPSGTVISSCDDELVEPSLAGTARRQPSPSIPSGRCHVPQLFAPPNVDHQHHGRHRGAPVQHPRRAHRGPQQAEELQQRRAHCPQTTAAAGTPCTPPGNQAWRDFSSRQRLDAPREPGSASQARQIQPAAAASSRYPGVCRLQWRRRATTGCSATAAIANALVSALAGAGATTHLDPVRSSDSQAQLCILRDVPAFSRVVPVHWLLRIVGYEPRVQWRRQPAHDGPGRLRPGQLASAAPVPARAGGQGTGSRRKGRFGQESMGKRPYDEASGQAKGASTVRQPCTAVQARSASQITVKTFKVAESAYGNRGRGRRAQARPSQAAANVH